MKTLDLAEAPALLAELAQDAHDEPTILTAHGRPIAAVVPIEDADDVEAVALGDDARFAALIEQSRQRQRELGGISPAELRRRLGH